MLRRILPLAALSIAGPLTAGASADPVLNCPKGTRLDLQRHPDSTPARLRCLRPDGEPDGPFVSYGRNGLPYERGEYANLTNLGLPSVGYVGFVDQWHSNGQLYSRTRYVGGLAQGPVEYFDSQGNRERTEVFVDGDVVDIYDGEEPHTIQCPPNTSPASSSFTPDRGTHSIDKWCERQQPPVSSVREGPSIHIDRTGAVAYRCESEVGYAQGVWYYRLGCSERGDAFRNDGCWRYDLKEGGSTAIPCPE